MTTNPQIWKKFEELIVDLQEQVIRLKSIETTEVVKAQASLEGCLLRLKEIFHLFEHPASIMIHGRHFTQAGGIIQDENFDFDAALKVTGDFGSQELKEEYAQMLTDVLNDYPRMQRLISEITDHEPRTEVDYHLEKILHSNLWNMYEK